MRDKRKLMHRKADPPAVLKPNAILTPTEPCAPEPKSTLDTKLVPRPVIISARYISLVGWLFTSHHQTRCASSSFSSSSSSAQEYTASASTINEKPTTFQDLPTEIHFHIAAFLPEHALLILAEYKYNAQLRHVYANAGPHGSRIRGIRLSVFDTSVYKELRMRDVFEMTCYPQNSSSPLNRAIWSTTSFHCSNCSKSVGTAHFPMTEMLESVQMRTGMSKITDRRCFAELTPVKLWNNRVVTWSQLHDAWANMDSHVPVQTLFSDHCNLKEPSESKIIPKRYTHLPNTLKLRDLDHAQSPRLDYTSTIPRELGVEATAEYYIDLYTPCRIRDIDAGTFTACIRNKQAYICPHLDLSQLMARCMSENPIEFRPESPNFTPDTTVAALLVKLVEQAPWKHEDGRRIRRSDSAPKKIREQAVWCGFKGDKCMTSVSIQRFRDSTNDALVTCWKDLLRLKVVRRWRVDRGSGDEGWQAQNGMSVRAVESIV